MIKVLFVCLGNICRSPLAKVIFKDLVEKEGLSDKIIIDSSGTSDYHLGQPPDERAREKALENGLQLYHEAKQISKEDLETFDYILAMDQSNYEYINLIAGQFDGYTNFNLKMMRDFDKHGKGEDVPDPYFGEMDGFQHVFEILSRSSHGFLRYLKEKHGWQ